MCSFVMLPVADNATGISGGLFPSPPPPLVVYSELFIQIRAVWRSNDLSQGGGDVA
jgi:hypothetical protein